MQTEENISTRSAVLQSEDLLGKILLKVGSSKQMIRCSGVSPHWRAVTKGRAFRRSFADRHRPAHVGFLVEMREGLGRITKLMYANSQEESAVAIRHRVNPALLAGEYVIGSKCGLLLTCREAEGYFTSFPADIPTVYAAVAPIIPKIPRDGGQHTVNTFGQFGLLENAGRTGFDFFVKDASRSFLSCYDGVSFCSANIFVHLCIHTNSAGWERYVSNPLHQDGAVLFHRNPYSVLVGNKMYLMYVVDYIISFDLVTKSFSKITLPGEVIGNVRSWYDYTISSHLGGGLVLLHYCQGFMYKWVLSFVADFPNWTLDSRVDLVIAFGPRISYTTWASIVCDEQFPIGTNHFYSIQTRKASSDGRYVLITLGFDLGMFEVDMLNSIVNEITNEERSGMLGRCFVLEEPWPART